MSKIKDIIEKMQSTPRDYHDLSLLVAKRVWLLIASLYYIAFLFTVGGFYFGPISLDQLSMITFHLYSILVIATAWFLYSLCEYGIMVYAPARSWMRWIGLLVVISFATFALLAHLHII